MIVPFYFNLLLRFLIPLVVYTKRKREDISNDNHKNDNVNNEELNEELEDITNTRSKIEELINKGVIDRVDNGLPVSVKDFNDLQDIKEEYESYFDEESGNNNRQGVKEIYEYLGEELASMPKNNKEDSNLPLENENKKIKTDDNTESKTTSTSSSSNVDLDSPIEMPSIFDDVD